MNIAAIVVNYNSRRFIFDCIDSLLAQTLPFQRIIVVDNASTDGSRERLRGISRIELLMNSHNEGFAVANNKALRMTAGCHVLCCNSDITLELDFLEKSAPHFDTNPLIGMITGKILRFDRRTIDSTGQFLSASRWPRERGFGEVDTGRYDHNEYVFSVCGACALYRREMIQELSHDGDFFDSRYFAFYEDLDVGWRAQRAGWRAYYVPVARAYHFRGGSSGSGRFSFARKSPEIRFHILKNRYLTMMKNDTLAGFLLHFPAILAKDVGLLGYTALRSPRVLWRLAAYFCHLRR